MKKLNLGCGTDIKNGYINLDRHNFNGVDVIHDLERYPYPFKDNTFDEMLAQDILEHLESFFDVMSELYRIGKNGCIIKIRVPHFSSATAFHTGHKLFFRYKSFDRSELDLDRFNNAKQFKVLKKRILFSDEHFNSLLLHKLAMHNILTEKIFNKIPLIYENSFLRCLFPAMHLYFELEVKK